MESTNLCKTKRKKSLVANIFTGPIMEKNLQVLEMRQKFLLLKHHNSGVFRCFERKMELQEMVPLGGHPPHPPGRGTSVKWVSIFEWTHTGEKPYNC